MNQKLSTATASLSENIQQLVEGHKAMLAQIEQMSKAIEQIQQRAEVDAAGDDGSGRAEQQNEYTLEDRLNHTEKELEQVFERLAPVMCALIRIAEKAEPEEASKFATALKAWLDTYEDQ